MLSAQCVESWLRAELGVSRGAALKPPLDGRSQRLGQRLRRGDLNPSAQKRAGGLPSGRARAALRFLERFRAKRARAGAGRGQQTPPVSAAEAERRASGSPNLSQVSSSATLPAAGLHPFGGCSPRAGAVAVHDRCLGYGGRGKPAGARGGGSPGPRERGRRREAKVGALRPRPGTGVGSVHRLPGPQRGPP